MKNIILMIAFAAFLFFNTPIYANSCRIAGNNLISKSDPEKTTFKVYGSCGMCEQRIEKAAKSIDGVKKASWDSSTQTLTLTYNPSVTNLEDVHKKIAEAGHDTEKVRAEDKVYDNLHGCCKYKRPEKTE